MIELLASAVTEGLNLSKSLSIRADQSVEKPVITFTKYGIALWGKALSFQNVDVVMNGTGSTPYIGEWNWMSICASRDASLSLDNVAMTMDGTGAGDAHAVYFCSNNKLNLTNGSVLTIRNYAQDALEWDGGDGGYNINMTNSVVNFSRNGSHGLSAGNLTIDHSTVTANDNGGNGIHVTGELSVCNGSDVTIAGNECSISSQ